MDQAGEDTAEGLNTERQGGNVEEENILDLTCENGTLDGSTDSNSFVGVNTSVGCFAEDVLNELLNLGHSGHSTDKKDIIDLILCQARVLDSRLSWLNGFLNKLINN